MDKAGILNSKISTEIKQRINYTPFRYFLEKNRGAPSKLEASQKRFTYYVSKIIVQLSTSIIRQKKVNFGHAFCQNSRGNDLKPSQE